MPRSTSEERVDSLREKSFDFSDRLEARLRRDALTVDTAHSWPEPSYWKEPVTFCLKVCGFRPWSKQIEIMHALRDHDRVAVATSHKTGKSATAAVLSLIHFASVYGSRVIMTSSSNHQVQNILWREMRIRMRTAMKGQCVHCVKLAHYTRQNIECHHGAKLEGDFSDVASTGMKAPDLREIIGFTAQDTERMAGISAPQIFYICDEASGIANQMFAAIEGNRAGGAKLLLLGNPTKNDGEFYEAHHTKSYCRITISAHETPNAVCGYKLIEGLATREWIEEKIEDWGEESAEYLVRVLGKFAIGEEGCTISLHLISEAQDRWHTEPGSGRLYIGVDVAGPGQQGDETVIAVRRGKRLSHETAYRGLTEDAILTNILGTINDNHDPKEPPPVVVVDVEGDIGNRVGKVIEAHLSQVPGSFVFVPVRASHNAVKMPMVYEKIRDDLWANMVRWLRAGGAIPEDAKLAQELHFPKWEQSPRSAKMKLTPKDVIRKRLKRSPDRAEALELACWEPADIQERDVEVQESIKQSVNVESDDGAAEQPFDAYSGAQIWG